MKKAAIIMLCCFCLLILGAVAQKSAGAKQECVPVQAVDLTDDSVKQVLSSAVSIIPVGQVEVETPRPGLKISKQRLKLVDELGHAVLVAGFCQGTCTGGCGVSGCDPDGEGGCDEVTCTGGTGCSAACSKVVEFEQ